MGIDLGAAKLESLAIPFGPIKRVEPGDRMDGLGPSWPSVLRTGCATAKIASCYFCRTCDPG
jgi:hypothetical protein